MNLLRVFKEAYALLTNEDVLRLAKTPWQTVALGLWATRLLRGDATIPSEFICLGQALRPVADGSANTLVLRAGLALHYDSSEGDLWLGKIKPLLFDQDQSVTITTNNDASGDDRLDVVAVRPVQVEGDKRSASFKTPGTAPGTGTFTKDTPHQVSWGLEVQSFEGVAAPSPLAPSLPSGWLKVATVLRPNSQADVNAGDVTDERDGDVLRSNHLELTGVGSLTRLILGGQQYAGESYSGIVRANDTESFWSAGDVVGIDNTFDDTKPSGTWWLDVLKVWSTLFVEELRTRAATRLDLMNADGTAFVPFLGLNSIHAFGTFEYSQANSRFQLKNGNGYNFETNGTRTSAGVHTIEMIDKSLSANDATVIAIKSNLGTTAQRDEFGATAQGTSPNVSINLRYFDDASGNPADPPASPNAEFFVLVLDANATPTP